MGGCIMQPDWGKTGRSTDPLARSEMQYESEIETQRRGYIPMKSINKAVKISAQTMRNVLKRNSVRFAAVLLVALASFVAAPNAALAAEPQHTRRKKSTSAW